MNDSNNLKYFEYLERSNSLVRFTLTDGFNLVAFTGVEVQIGFFYIIVFLEMELG